VRTLGARATGRTRKQTAAQRSPPAGAEERRLEQDARRAKNWKRWGPYLAERQWGTVREDYSAEGAAWEYFPHAHARSRAYRWGEDGLLGICDRQARLCFALALWNGVDPILKERLFGLSGPQGNHGEDVKECYYYLDSTPTHAHMRALYKYPQRAFPYRELQRIHRERSRAEPECELEQLGVFDEDRYFDVELTYSKADDEDLLICVRVANRGPQAARLELLPTLWFRNTWAWGTPEEERTPKPWLRAAGAARIEGAHFELGEFELLGSPGPDGSAPELLFTENETNAHALFGASNAVPFVKDAFHRRVVHGDAQAVNPTLCGTKAALRYAFELEAGGSAQVRLRLRVGAPPTTSVRAQRAALGSAFERIAARRAAEADAWFAARAPSELTSDERNVLRQAWAGLLWSKQFYHYVVPTWLAGDARQPAPPAQRKDGRNSEWTHVFNRDVISMPDKWEYPWYAAWDLAFHMIPFARIDAHFAKSQLELLLREWYMHPNGQIPAYEWAFSDVNPPVHAWACWRVYKRADPPGKRDRRFLASCFQKLLLNFTWWVNRKDAHGRHVFSGGFLGMDNVSVFDRSQPMPDGGRLEQADATAWMAFYCGTMLSMALELAQHDRTYEDMASKFFEHYVHIADAMNHLGGDGLWSDADGFYYDQLELDGRQTPLRLRSMVGLIPLIAVEVLDQSSIDALPGFRARMEWFLRHRADLAAHIAYCESGRGAAGTSSGRRLLSIPSRERLQRILRCVFDEAEFLAPHGLRSLSKAHAAEPYTLRVGGSEHRIGYEPGESQSALFGGNSNWRGPVWFPINFLLIEALERYHHFYGDALLVELPTGSGRRVSLQQAADELARRLSSLFLRDERGARPCHGSEARYAADAHWRELLLFHEYFHGETGAGLGASHQTGWTALAGSLIEHQARLRASRSASGARKQARASARRVR
jgi:hypothetical protein